MKTKIHIVTFIIGMVMIVQQNLNAQNHGAVKGQVIDSLTKETLPNANVFVMVGDQMIGTTTDLDGRFTLKPLEPGSYNLTISYTGMKKVIEIRINPNQTTMLPDVFLSNEMLDDIVITGYKNPLINPEETSVQTVDYKQIKNNPNLRDLKKLSASMTGGIMVTESGDAYVRGSRSDASIYFIDGVKVTSGNIHLPGVAIGSLTIYTGGVPAKYGDVTSGVIMVETKSYFDLWREANQQ